MLSVPCPQGSSHSDQETFHQCSGGVRPVATLCVGVARVYRAQGECRDCVGGQSHHPVWLPPLSVCVFQTTPTLLALMGIRYEGLISAIVLPLLLTMVTLIYTPPELTEYLHTCFTPWVSSNCPVFGAGPLLGSAHAAGHGLSLEPNGWYQGALG